MAKSDIQIPPGWFSLCTLEWAQSTMKTQNHKLGTLLQYIGAPKATLHRALADAQGASHLLKYLVKPHDNQAEAIEKQATQMLNMAERNATRAQKEYLEALGVDSNTADYSTRMDIGKYLAKLEDPQKLQHLRKLTEPKQQSWQKNNKQKTGCAWLLITALSLSSLISLLIFCAITL